MFGKLRDKLKGWIKGSSEKVEETAEKKEVKVVEKPVKVKKEKKEKKDKKEKEKKESKKEVKEKPVKEKEVKEVEKETKDVKETPASKKDPAEILSEQPVEEIVETVEEKKDEGAMDVGEKIKDVKKEVVEEEGIEEKADEIIEKAKKEEAKEPPMKFDVGKQKYEPDVEGISGGEKEEVDDEKEEEIKRLEKAVEEGEKDVAEKKSLFSRFKSSFSYKIGEDEFDEIFDDLEMLLLENNVALEVIDKIKEDLSENLIGREINKSDLEEEIRKELKNSLNEILIEPDNPLDIVKEKKEKPFVILFFGINGTGKTTSIAKITHFLKEAGMSVVLAAGDTFRAASIEQISEHAKRLEVPLIKHGYESDPAAVGFDAIKYAKSHGADVVLIDTAGRMHTKANLMSEMEKIVRVTKPDLKIFVAESIAGNDAVEQAKAFHESVGMDGSILSKADIDEKGGTIISVSHATGKPIFYLGVGQNYEDLRLFNKQEFIDNLGL